MKKYEIDANIDTCDFIPHRRQAIVLFKCIFENKELFQSLNDKFWNDYINPIFIKNEKLKLFVEPERIYDENKGYNSSSYKITYQGRDFEVGNNIYIYGNNISGKKSFQNKIFDLIVNEISASTTSGYFEEETFKYAFFLFTCSDLTKASKYLSKNNIKNNNIFSLPLNNIQGAKGIIEKNSIALSWGFDNWRCSGQSNGILKLGEGLAKNYIVYEFATNLICDELKTTNFYSSLLANGFMDWVTKNTKVDLKLPKVIENKMQLMVWKNIAKKTKITKKSFEDLVGPFSWNNSCIRLGEYQLDALNFLCSIDDKLKNRVYFKEIIQFNIDDFNIEDFKKIKNIDLFWFTIFYNEVNVFGDWNYYNKNKYIKQFSIIKFIYSNLSSNILENDEFKALFEGYQKKELDFKNFLMEKPY
jgi:hypothetical protein